MWARWSIACVSRGKKTTSQLPTLFRWPVIYAADIPSLAYSIMKEKILYRSAMVIPLDSFSFSALLRLFGCFLFLHILVKLWGRGNVKISSFCSIIRFLFLYHISRCPLRMANTLHWFPARPARRRFGTRQTAASTRLQAGHHNRSAVKVSKITHIPFASNQAQWYECLTWKIKSI